ncbi:AarF/ABC1/UbiB kinase family protein [Alkalimonas collagenimarina]|uniref:AarF/ABC1/UbiB kinase family protein n=1 Tax=Alkalimonas collagenimarina TaxID=400390 RepID=A0ABT9H2W8_9GAMM|nr:AarF/ABC1/UbiB kinase family protein [Alkalimonas collagenimarina]MDP4537647.1 AarF/ABC1/UbiB kinase family protein [Alkalimonas collagenimarina]
MASSSKVPSGRLARFSSLAGLAGKLAGGMLAEGARRMANGEKSNRLDLLLTPSNIKRVTDKLAHMRGAAMKLGQLLSMDAGDLIPAELAELLARLRDNANPMLPKQLATVLRTELGNDWQRHFADFEFKPMAAASIGQVHRAQHDKGQRLAVKVQYPGVKQSIESDVDNVASLLKISGLLPAGMDYGALLDEAKIQLQREADYLQEADYMTRFYHHLQHDPRYVVPQPNTELSTANILVMDFVEGVPVESLQAEPQALRDQVMVLLFELFFKELFEFRLVQTDPNFANYRYNLSTKQLVLLDFGACRDYSEAFSDAYRLLFGSALNNQEAGVEQAMRDIGFFSQDIAASQRERILQLVQLACEPLQHSEPFDFGHSDLANRIREAGTALSLQHNYWHTPPADAIFLHRKIGGLYLLAARLKARVNVRALLQAYLD